MIQTSYLNTQKAKRKERKAWALVIFEGMLVFAILGVMLFFMIETGMAETITEQVWVLCNPESYVTLRSGPGKSRASFGGAPCGYLHVMEIPAEETEGWIISRNIVYDRPHEVNGVMEIRAEGRVACRKWIEGKIIGWAHDGDQLTVYWMSASWAVTNRGYIRSEFLTEVAVG